MGPVECVAQAGLDPIEQPVVSLLVFQNKTHDQSDHRVPTRRSNVFILVERVLFSRGVPLDGIQEPLNGARFRAILLTCVNRKTRVSVNNSSAGYVRHGSISGSWWLPTACCR